MRMRVSCVLVIGASLLLALEVQAECENVAANVTACTDDYTKAIAEKATIGTVCVASQNLLTCLSTALRPCPERPMEESYQHTLDSIMSSATSTLTTCCPQDGPLPSCPLAQTTTTMVRLIETSSISTISTSQTSTTTTGMPCYPTLDYLRDCPPPPPPSPNGDVSLTDRCRNVASYLHCLHKSIMGCNTEQLSNSTTQQAVQYWSAYLNATCLSSRPAKAAIPASNSNHDPNAGAAQLLLAAHLFLLPLIARLVST